MDSRLLIFFIIFSSSRPAGGQHNNQKVWRGQSLDLIWYQIEKRFVDKILKCRDVAWWLVSSDVEIYFYLLAHSLYVTFLSGRPHTNTEDQQIENDDGEQTGQVDITEQIHLQNWNVMES